MSRRHRFPLPEDHDEPHYRFGYDGNEPPTLNMDARFLTLPLLTIAGVVVMFVVGTYTILSERHRIDNRISLTIVAVERIAESVDRLATTFTDRTEGRYTRYEHQIWCAKAERLNKDFKCPDMDLVKARASMATGSVRETESTIRDKILEGLDRIK